jgi:hypothetical protein
VDEEWLGLEQALEHISRTRDVGPGSAKTILLQACASRKVRSRYYNILAVDSQHLQIGYRQIHPGEWDASVIPVGYIDFSAGTFHTVFDDRGGGPIQICASDLKSWLARPRRGPRPGTVSRFAARDQALFPEIENRLRSGKAASATEAARQLAEEGRVAGQATEDSRARRLATAYKKTL